MKRDRDSPRFDLSVFGNLFGGEHPRRKSQRRYATFGMQTAHRYKLGEKSVLVLQKGDLTKWKGDAIVNAANERMLGGGGVDGAIHRAAGPQLYKACKDVPLVADYVRCPTGQARITEGFRLPASYVIHTVGPVYSTPQESEPLLESAYKNSLKLANDRDLKKIAFPAISCGVYGYPLFDAAEVSLKTIKDHHGDLEEVHFVLFESAVMNAYTETAESLFKTDVKRDFKAEGTDTSTSKEEKKSEKEENKEKGEDMETSKDSAASDMNLPETQSTSVMEVSQPEEKIEGEVVENTQKSDMAVVEESQTSEKSPDDASKDASKSDSETKNDSETAKEKNGAEGEAVESGGDEKKDDGDQGKGNEDRQDGELSDAERKKDEL